MTASKYRKQDLIQITIAAYAKQIPAATATALPPELPPGICHSGMLSPSLYFSKAQTFLVGPNMESTVPFLQTHYSTSELTSNLTSNKICIHISRLSQLVHCLPHSKLVHVCFPHNHSPGINQFLNYRSSVRRLEIMQHFRAARSRNSIHTEIVLHSNWNAV